MAYVPDAIQGCFDTINDAMPQVEMGGIYANKPGYHNARNQLPSSDYSVQKSYDKEGNGDAASALDATFRDPADMKAVTGRMITETQANADTGLLHGARSFFGTTDGYTVTGMDVPGQYWVTSDPSHLWHIHVSGKRRDADDHQAWQDIAAVILGGTTPDDLFEEIMSYYDSRAEFENKMFDLMTSAVQQFLVYGGDGHTYSFDTLLAKRVSPINQRLDAIDAKLE